MTKAERHTIAVDQVVELCRLARRAFKAGERGTYTRDAGDAEQRAGQRFEEAAEIAGFTVDWPGLWPALTDRNGYAAHLPV